MTNHIRRVRRMDGVPEVVTKEVEVSKLVEPKFLTLTRSPANEVAFKVVRDDSGSEDVKMTQQNQTGNTRRRVRSTKRSALLCIEFPEGTTEEDVTTAVADYGLDGYTMEVSAAGHYSLKRSDLDALPENTMNICLNDGRKAVVERAAGAVPTPENPTPFISVAALEFDTTVVRSDDVQAFLQTHDIDYLEDGIKSAEGKITVTRSALEENTEVRRIEVQSGVVAVVTRAETADFGCCSSPFIAVVSEEAYGQWGWGQLDFNASLADVEFSRLTEDAIWRLRNVLDNILFYSELPVSVRKELVARATVQFSEYIAGLLDALPTKVILINRSSLESNKEKQMSKTENKAEGDGATTERKDEVTQAAAADDSTPVTRSELNNAVNEIKALITGSKGDAGGESTQRSDEPGATEAAPEAAKGKGEPDVMKVVEEVVTRSTGPVLDAVKAISDRMEKLEGTAVVRSDSSDANGAEGEGDGSTKRSDKPSVFAGVLSHSYQRQ